MRCTPALVVPFDFFVVKVIIFFLSFLLYSTGHGALIALSRFILDLVSTSSKIKEPYPELYAIRSNYLNPTPRVSTGLCNAFVTGSCRKYSTWLEPKCLPSNALLALHARGIETRRKREDIDACLPHTLPRSPHRIRCINALCRFVQD